MNRSLHLVAAFLIAPLSAPAQSPLLGEVDRLASGVEAKVLDWRRDFHQHPELSNRETRTAAAVAAHLRALGLEVRTGVAHTGVVGVLRGGRPGAVVALRADMDALPVTEEVDLPFRSHQRGEYNGQEVGIMHACGHDSHVAMLMGAAEILAGVRDQLPGTVVFIFQPAEEGAPPGERGGAELMIEEGVLANPAPTAIFGLHVFTTYATGVLAVRPQGLMASSDRFEMIVRGRQTHGALPWGGVDPIVVAAQIIGGLQTIVSRQVDLTGTPAVITVGTINGGVRFNIIPDSVVMTGTIRTFDPAEQKLIHERIHLTAESIARSAGATAEVRIATQGANPVTFNDPALTERMRPTLVRVAGPGKTVTAQQTTTAEDFSHYQRRIPGMFVFLGITPPDQDPLTAPRNHSPRFFLDEGALPVGTRLYAHLALDYLLAHR
jgi:amidohydrolase